MCFNWQNIQQAQDRQELTLEEIEKISKSLPRLMELNISGGEPFLRRDLVEILQCFYENSNTRLFTIPTNSSNPDRITEFAEKMCLLMPSGWFRLTLSLSHIGEENDSIRGRQGSFQEIIETANRLDKLKKRYPQISTGCSVVLTKFNKEKIYDIFDYIDSNIPCDSFGFLIVRGNPMDKRALEVKPEEVKKLADYLQMKRKSKIRNTPLYSKFFLAVGNVVENNVLKTILEKKEILPCLAGRRMIVISDTGEVMPCELMDGVLPKNLELDPVLGNLRDYDYNIKKIMELPNTKNLLQFIKTSKCYCSFECAMAVNTAFNPRCYPEILSSFFKIL